MRTLGKTSAVSFLLWLLLATNAGPAEVDPLRQLEQLIHRVEGQVPISEEAVQELIAIKKELFKKAKSDAEYRSVLAEAYYSAAIHGGSTVDRLCAPYIREAIGKSDPYALLSLFRRVVTTEDAPPWEGEQFILDTTHTFRPKEKDQRRKYDQELAKILADYFVATRGEKKSAILALVSGRSIGPISIAPVGRAAGLRAIRKILPTRWTGMADDIGAVFWTDHTLWLMDQLLKYDKSFKTEYVQKLKDWVSEPNSHFSAVQRVDFAHRLESLGEKLDDKQLKDLEEEVKREEEEFRAWKERMEETRKEKAQPTHAEAPLGE